jgi:gliding motility-associated-like protein
MPLVGANIYRNALLTIFIVCACLSGVFGQGEYLATFDYNSIIINRIANIPAISWISDNSAYDPTHQRYFFQGNTTQVIPFYLYTIDAVSGAVLSNPIVANGQSRTYVTGLEYNSDTLYCLYHDGSGSLYFAWIEIATGIVHPKQGLSNIPSYFGSTFDSRDRYYIWNTGTTLIVIDAGTGNIVYNPTLSGGMTASDLVFDNTNGNLYSICRSGASAPQFCSISLSTGAVNVIATLPAIGIPQVYTYTIDEAAGKYMFVGADLSATVCVKNYLFVLDVSTGNILSQNLYPYAQSSGSLTAENVVNFCFDNTRGLLYALNWHLPGLTPSVTIAASSQSICKGDVASFAATPVNEGANPVYQWLVNGVNVGPDAPNYSSDTLSNGDTIRCIALSQTPCVLDKPDTSNAIVMSVGSNSALVSITASSDNICAGDTVVFTATPSNGGPAPVFEWQVNGNEINAGGQVFTSASLANGDVVDCILKGSLACSLLAESNSVTMMVRPVPAILLAPDTIIQRGQSVRLDPATTGTIVSYQWTPSNGLSDPTVPDPSAAPLTTTNYRLDVTAANGCIASSKETIEVYTPLWMPNAFTPNGDGNNDVFRIPPAVSIVLTSLSIYNRWGQRVFSTINSSEGWDGRTNGQPAPAGVYVWEIDYKDLGSGQMVHAKGNVLVIR